MKTAALLKQLACQCAVPDCIEPAVDVIAISINNAPKKTLPVCNAHADAAVDDLWKERNRDKPVQPTSTLPDMLRIKVDGETHDVPRKAYVAAKTKQMVEFGYPSVTEAGVNEQIEALIAKKEYGQGLTVIGMFMKDELILPTT